MNSFIQLPRIKNLIPIVFCLLIACEKPQETIKEFSYEEMKTLLSEKEQLNPKQFFELKGTLKNIIKKGGLFSSDKIIGKELTLSIQNKACATTFKDLEVAIGFYSKTGSEIERRTISLFEFFEPLGTSTFTKRIEVPEQSEEYRLFVDDVGEGYNDGDHEHSQE